MGGAPGIQPHHELAPCNFGQSPKCLDIGRAAAAFEARYCGLRRSHSLRQFLLSQACPDPRCDHLSP